MKKLRLTKFKSLNRKQKNLAGLILIAVIAIIVCLIYFLVNNTTTIKQNLQIENINDISKIIIKDKDNRTIILEKKDNDSWTVNKKFEANKVLISTVLETFKDMRIREPIPKAARNNVVKDLATMGKTVEVYTMGYAINIGSIKLFKKEKLEKTYYVGTETPDEMGTFILKKGDNTPYIVHIPNFRGYLSSRFSTIEDLWRTHNVFKYKQSEIESIKVELPNDAKENYTLVNNGNGFSFITSDGKTLPAFDTNKVLAFLSSFVEMNYERVAKNIPQVEKDTIFTKAPSFIITLNDKKGKTETLKTFVKLSDPTSIAKDDKDFYQIFDVNRCYALSSRYATDTLIMQFFNLDNVLKPASYFYIGAEGIPLPR